jgi:hypothetical protein
METRVAVIGEKVSYLRGPNDSAWKSVQDATEKYRDKHEERR